MIISLQARSKVQIEARHVRATITFIELELRPAATEQELFELLVDAVKDEPEVKDAIIREYVWHVAAH
jgi:hypothetical protein